jgi:hypothetical protein
MEWNYLVISISAIVALLLIVKELRRKVRRNLTARLLATSFALIALGLIALPPTYKRTTDGGKQRDFVLLTEGFSRDSLSEFSNPVVVSADEKLLKESGFKNGLQIPAIDYYLAENPQIQTIHILGFGLKSEELDRLQNMGVQFHEGRKPFGFQNVNWARKISSGKDLVLTGTFNNATGKEIKLVLKGLGTTLDSAMISPDSLANFKLTCIPRQLGRAINNLLVISGQDTLSIEKIPFEIEQSEPLNILLLSSSPDFEINFLKQWLAENKFSVAARSRISQGKFSTEFLNMDPASLNLQSSSLKQLDLIIADETALAGLNYSEQRAIRNEVDEGLGLLIRDEDDVRLPGIFGRPATTIPAAPEEKLTIYIPENNIKLQLPGKGGNYIQERVNDQPLVKDGKRRTLVNRTMSADGRIIFSTINNSYTWKLSGNATDYSAFWSYLIEKASRKKQSDYQAAIAEMFPVIQQQNTLLLQTNSAELPTVASGESVITLEQDLNLPNRFKGYFWPTTEGWNFLSLPNRERSPWYVYNDKDWKSVRNALNLQATKDFADQSNIKTDQSTANKGIMEVRIPAIIFYLLFLLCCTYLWIETKFL